MTDKEIADLILRRLYSGAFEPNVDCILNLNDFALKLKVDNDRIWEIYEQLKEKNLIESFALGGLIRITSYGILYCEESGLAESELIQHQKKVRTKLLDTLATIQEERGRNFFVDWQHLCKEAGVEEQDYNNNSRFLSDMGMWEKKTHRALVITPEGREKIKDYRKRVKRLESFQKLEKLNGVTPQQRGHKLEDLLVEVAQKEGWEAESRVRSQGQEHDIIIHTGLHYFIISCKWEKKPIQPHEVELLESRIRSRATTNGGLLFSMSGFTDNCIEEARMKISSAQILLFGQLDIKNIFYGESTLTNLLDSKLEQAMHHRKIIVDVVSK